MFYEAYVKTPDSEEVKAVMEQASSFDLDNLRKKPDKKEAWLRTIWNKSRNMNWFLPVMYSKRLSGKTKKNRTGKIKKYEQTRIDRKIKNRGKNNKTWSS